MDVKFIKVAAANLGNVPVVDGQIIALTDANSIYYDMNGVRRRSAIYGTSNTCGLVYVNDSYTSSAGTASNSVAASSKAVADCYAAVCAKMQDTGHLLYESTASVGTTYQSYSCNWSNYKLLMICISFYSNIVSSIVVPTTYFSGTNSSLRPFCYLPANSAAFCEVYQNGPNAVYLKASPNLAEAANYRIQIFGIIAST